MGITNRNPLKLMHKWGIYSKFSEGGEQLAVQLGTGTGDVGSLRRTGSLFCSSLHVSFILPSSLAFPSLMLWPILAYQITFTFTCCQFWFPKETTDRFLQPGLETAAEVNSHALGPASASSAAPLLGTSFCSKSRHIPTQIARSPDPWAMFLSGAGHCSACKKVAPESHCAIVPSAHRPSRKLLGRGMKNAGDWGVPGTQSQYRMTSCPALESNLERHALYWRAVLGDPCKESLNFQRNGNFHLYSSFLECKTQHEWETIVLSLQGSIHWLTLNMLKAIYLAWKLLILAVVPALVSKRACQSFPGWGTKRKSA